MRAINVAVDAIADEMRREGHDPGAVIVALKAVLAEYPATALIHADAIRRGIERYYAPETPNVSRMR